jgi:erythromycin esterase-like protein
MKLDHGRRMSGLFPFAAAAMSVAVLVPSVAAGPAQSVSRRSDPVSRWIDHNAQALHTTDPHAPLGDLKPLQKQLRGATIAGLGEAVHGARQITGLKMRATRLLVERMGFRTLAWEDAWTTGYRINRYLRTGAGNPVKLVGQMTGQWQSRQTVDTLRWLRQFNTGRCDKVTFFGVEYYYTGRLAYDAVEEYVAGSAPSHLATLLNHLGPIRPTVPYAAAYAQRYAKVRDKAPYIRHARHVYRLIRGLPHRGDDRAYAVALHHARQILSFHEHYALPINDQNIYREAHVAQNIRWWQRLSGDRIAYWAATPHTANAPSMRIGLPGGEEFRFPSSGYHLGRWYDDSYVSVGFTFDHGTVGLRPGKTFKLTAPKPHWFERRLGRQHTAHFVLDVDRPAPPPVRSWLHGPLTTRGLPQAGPTSTISGGSVTQWFDAVVHTQRVQPLDAL